MAKSKKTTAPNAAFDFSELMKMYDPEKVAELFDPKKVFEQIPGLNADQLDVSKIVEANKASFDAMVEANKATAENYRGLLEKQMDVLGRMTTAAQDAAQNVQNPVSQDAMTDNAQIVSDAAQKAFDMMREMAENAQSANQAAFERLSAQVTSAMDDLKKG